MATKVSLRQFQQDLSQRISAARSEAVSLSRLGVQCGSRFWLVGLEDAGEILPVPDVLPVPLTKPWYLGVANIRGSLFSVVDFSAFSHGEPTTRGADNRLVLAGARLGINAALLVSRMHGLRYPSGTVESAPVDAPAWSGSSWKEATVSGAAQGRVWQELQYERLVEDPQFLNVGI
jgi:twitching motility protein PilI